MKLAFISDAHMFQTFIEKYDPVVDFERALKSIVKHEPDVLFMAGDMFDYRKTPTTYVRHYEGEGLMIKIRKLLKEFNKPVYALRGNHEKEEVLTGLQQTVPNFHYTRNDWASFDDCAVYLMDSHYKPSLNTHRKF